MTSCTFHFLPHLLSAVACHLLASSQSCASLISCCGAASTSLRCCCCRCRCCCCKVFFLALFHYGRKMGSADGLRYAEASDITILQAFRVFASFLLCCATLFYGFVLSVAHEIGWTKGVVGWELGHSVDGGGERDWVDSGLSGLGTGR
ncbi:uncharacterized protein IWZ02DRAFT_94086 [Phyllosticta citriasiana]|uniref:uncharacterized protein n=1 Tax=Phyllosticta citriasiana TaxID=595635 RepID=UPI0030FD99C9